MLKLLFERFIARQREYHVYVADGQLAGAGDDDEIEVFDDRRPPPRPLVALYGRETGASWPGLMFRRLRRGESVFLALCRDDELIGFGWIQSREPLRHEFWWLEADARALGPFWTHPRHRGLGVYGRLLRRALAECGKRDWSRLYIWAERHNQASIRGIEKAGFRSVGTHRVASYCLGAIRRHVRLECE
jgi:RimJ/RimL family protein N-acetyltransferase